MKLKTSIFFVIFLFLFTSVAFANSEKAAVIEEVVGNVFVTKGAGKVEYRAKAGMYLYQGDSIRTEKNSLVKINFGDGDATTLGENGKITIVELSEENDTDGNGDFRSLATKKKVTVKQESGKTWTKVNNLLNSGKRHKVETATAVMGVRGTLFLIDTSADGLVQVSVLDGKVAVDIADAQDQQEETTVNPGEQYTVSGIDGRNTTVNFIELLNQIQPEMGVEIIQDVIVEAEEKVQETAEMLKNLEENPSESLAQQSLQLTVEAELMTTILKQLFYSVNGAENGEQIKNMLPKSFTQLMENANELYESVQTMKQQVDQIIEQQFHLSKEEVEQMVAEKRKLVEDIVRENPVTPPTSSSDSDNNDSQSPSSENNDRDDSETAPTIPLTPPTGEHPGTNDSFVPLYTGDGVQVFPLSWEKIKNYREIDDVIGGMKIAINKHSFQNEGYDIQYYAVRNTKFPESFTIHQLMPISSEELIPLEDNISYDWLLKFTPENEKGLTLVFYNEQQNPVVYFQAEIDFSFYQNPTLIGNGYMILIDGNDVFVDLLWNRPLSGDHFTYEIYESEQPISDFTDQLPTYITDEPSYRFENPDLNGEMKYYYIVAVNNENNKKSEPLEIVVVYEYPDLDINKINMSIPSWKENGNEITGITYLFDDPIDFLLFGLNNVEIENIDYIQFVDNDGDVLRTLNYFADFLMYSLNLTDVAKIEVGFKTPLATADFNDYQFLVLQDAKTYYQKMLGEKTTTESNVAILKMSDIYSGFEDLQIYVDGQQTNNYIEAGNEFTITGLESGIEYDITFYVSSAGVVYVDSMKVIPN